MRMLNWRNPKSKVAAMLQALPDATRFKDIQYHLYVLEKIRLGLNRAETERAISQDDVKRRLSKWRSN